MTTYYRFSIEKSSRPNPIPDLLKDDKFLLNLENNNFSKSDLGAANGAYVTKFNITERNAGATTHSFDPTQIVFENAGKPQLLVIFFSSEREGQPGWNERFSIAKFTGDQGLPVRCILYDRGDGEDMEILDLGKPLPDGLPADTAFFIVLFEMEVADGERYGFFAHVKDKNDTKFELKCDPQMGNDPPKQKP